MEVYFTNFFLIYTLLFDTAPQRPTDLRHFQVIVMEEYKAKSQYSILPPGILQKNAIKIKNITEINSVAFCS